jgi:hypothetical protein
VNTSFGTFSGGPAATMTLDSKVLFSGQSVKAAYASSLRQARFNITAVANVKGRFFFSFDSFSPTQAIFVSLRGGSANLAQIQMQSSGVIRLQNVAAVVATAGFACTVGTIYYAEYEKVGTTQTLRVYNAAGTTLLGTLTGACPATSVDQIGFGNPASDSYVAYFDSIDFNDTTQPGYPSGGPPPDTDTTDTYIWNGTALVPCDVFIWNGTALVPSAVTIQ